MNLTLVVALLFLLPLFFILTKRSRRKSVSQKLPLPPSPRGLPFIGNLLELGTLPHRSLFHLSKKHGPLMLLHFGSIPTMVVSSTAFAQEVMRTHDLAFSSRPMLKVSRVLSYNNVDVAFSPYGECWRQMRKVCVTHLLSPKMVQSFSHVRIEEVAQLLKRISKYNGSSICITEMLSELANNVLCRVVLGSSMNDERRRIICDLVERNSYFLSKVFVEDFFPRFKWLDWILGLEDKLMSHFEAWDVLLEEFIKDNSIDKSNDRTDRNFVDVLLRLQKDSSMEFVITKEHIKSTLLDMFSAGTDTTFTTLNWSLAELIRNPKVMKKAQDEVRAIADGDDMIKEEHLRKMFYLKAVVKEVLQLHPPSPLLLPRESTQDCKVLGYHIPKQTRVIINAWALGREKAYWEAPEEFKPERFLDGIIDFKGKELCFIPFGAGRRICPGTSFAIAIIELVLANLLHHFDWALPNGISAKDMSMEEGQGLVALRKEKLELVPILVKKAS